VNLAQVLHVCLRDEGDQLWALEQCLRSGACAAVLGWFARPPLRHLRRLRLAAENGDCFACLFYPPGIHEQATPAALRIAVARQASGISVRILKRRGGWPCGPITLPAPEPFPFHFEPLGVARDRLRKGSSSCHPERGEKSAAVIPSAARDLASSLHGRSSLNGG
jgi:hypothetical protein